MTDLTTVFDRLGGRRGVIDGAAPRILFAATHAGTTLLGDTDGAMLLAVAVAVASASALGILRRIQGP